MTGKRIVALVFWMLAPLASAQTLKAVVDCHAQRLVSEGEICASPGLSGTTVRIDTLTAELELVLKGLNREALVDTQRVFLRDRNDCSNRLQEVKDCVTGVLQRRLDALEEAKRSPASILDEVTQYSHIDVAYFQKWAARLLGDRVRVAGSMTLDPGATSASRMRGELREDSEYKTGPERPPVVVFFKFMNETKAVGFYDQKHPHSRWEGVVERRGSQFVLAQVEP